MSKLPMDNENFETHELGVVDGIDMEAEMLEFKRQMADRKITRINKLRHERLQKNNKLKGVGDAVKKVTEFLGIKQCGGCKKRQEMLNKMFPFKE